MGKKVKKKAARNAQKEKRLPTSSPEPISQENTPPIETLTNGDATIKEAKTCPHLDKGINFEKFSSKISSLESLKCDDCREGAADRKTKKGKVKQGKNKVNGSKSESNSIWVCLECGQFSCGGVGFPTTPQTHAARHAKLKHHPLVFKFTNPNLRWCFSCSTVIPVQSLTENGEQKDSLSEFVKLLKTRSVLEPRVDVEDVWFGSGSVLSEGKSVNSNILPISSENTGGYKARGLVNLGNTCFFNSVLQNLLAMVKLRDYFLKLEGSFGPLSVSLKKLFVETGSNPSTGAKNVINPRSFFGCVCTKAPQFRGYQQHDSHELLRCLLDGLCIEESSARKRSREGNIVSEIVPTFVDSIFGGQISSTVSCLECGHASVVYEPYLDLSLPLPTKKSPSKKVSSVSRNKKPKIPPKRQGKIRPKTKKSSNSNLLVVSSITSASTGDESEKNVAISSNSTQQESVVLDEIEISDKIDSSESLSNNNYKGTVDSSNELNIVSNDHDAAKDAIECEEVQGSTVETSEHVDSIDSEVTSWLDYLEPSTSNVDNAVIQDSENSNEVSWEEEPLLKVQESEVLLLPYKEIISEHEQEQEQEHEQEQEQEQEQVDFDGFGGLFDEPEVESGPTLNPISNGVLGSGLAVTSNSESDHDEVDDSDSSLSVEKCLAYFTTPELLTKSEHAWPCEQCSKSLLKEKSKLKNKLEKALLNGGENGVLSASSDSGIELSNGGENVNDRVNTKSVDVALCNGKIEEGSIIEVNCESENTESCSVNGPTADEVKNENIMQRESESDSSEDEDDEVDSKGVQVARDASKRILISRAPPVLTIHLKRFCQDARGRLSKLNGHVDFRDTIDLKPYMDPGCCKDREIYKYQLIGVVEHLGTMRGGHYVAYVRGGEKGSIKNNNDNKTGEEYNKDCTWYHASDAYVREASYEEVLRCEAYILFYEEM